MPLKKDERYRCPDPQCGCEIQELVNRFHQFVVNGSIAQSDGIGRTAFEVVTENVLRHPSQSRLNTSKLLQDFNTETLFSEHPRDSPHLPFDAIQPQVERVQFVL